MTFEFVLTETINGIDYYAEVEKSIDGEIISLVVLDESDMRVNNQDIIKVFRKLAKKKDSITHFEL